MCPKPPWWSILLVGGALAVGGHVTGNKWLWYGAAGIPALMLGANLICSRSQGAIAESTEERLPQLGPGAGGVRHGIKISPNFDLNWIKR